MVFSSLFFLYAFFPAVMLAYRLCGTTRSKNYALLLFSLFFYAWGGPKYLLLLMGMSAADWFLAIRIADTSAQKAKKAYLIAACAVDLGLIGFFKYSAFICSIFGEVPQFISDIALPIGISFYTFQLLSYVVDVYREDAPAQRSYLNVLLYAALFHQCIAGPIVRYKTIADELFSDRVVPESDVEGGILRFSTGLAKKVILANSCGKLVDTFVLSDADIANPSLLQSNLSALSSTSVLGLWIGVIAFCLQIYLDFSAYSDMAVGMGKMIGLHYPENFNYPYISRSVTEFWRRWHISLGTFFRDYVYIPLGGNRRGLVRTIFNIFMVWALTGLWHGANWNYIFWGLSFFVLLTIEKTGLKKLLDRLPVISNIYLLFIVALTMALFHCTDVRLYPSIVKGLFGLNGNSRYDFMTLTTLKNNCFLLIISAVCSTPLLRGIWRRLCTMTAGRSFSNTAVRIAGYYIAPAVLVILSTAMLVGNTYNPFLYFQF